MQHSEATESHCGGVTLDQMTGVESSHAFTEVTQNKSSQGSLV